MEKGRFKSKKSKLKKGEFLLYYVNGLNYIKDKLNTDYLITEHIKYSKLTDEERLFYYEYEKSVDNKDVAEVKPVRPLTFEEINEGMNLAAIEHSKYARYREIKRKMNLKPVGKQHKVKLHHKFNYLIHSLCSRCTNNEDGYTNINAEFLKNLIGDEYNTILYTLERIGLVGTDGIYTIGHSSKMYYLKEKYIPSINTKPETNIAIKKYIDKAFQKLEAHKKAKFQRLSERDKFIVEKYDSCLFHLQMTRIDECEDFIYSKKIYDEKKTIQKEYYENIYSKYVFQENGKFRINQIDNDNRIYHILTSTPKDLKEYLNIKFSIDIKNSHPLLLNKLLLIYYSDKELFNNIINNNINIYNILISSNVEYTHYASDNLRKSLLLNNINCSISNLQNIPPDVRQYISQTSQGLMWEELLDACESQGLQADSRGELKTQMFAEVFYSKTKIIAYKEFGKVFKTIYPNVYKIINKLKPNGEETMLSHLIMKIESELFHQILERIYKNTKYDAINIHDAIVLLDTPNNENCNADEIETIMKDIYNTYNLFPSFSIDIYNPD